MSTYRKDWPCCGLVTETDCYELDSCPECDLMIKEKFHKAEVEVLQKKITALETLITECTDCGELDSRLFNSYMEHIINNT